MGVEVWRIVGVSVAGASLPQPVSRRAAIDRHIARGCHLNLPVRVSNTIFPTSVHYVRIRMVRITGGVDSVHPRRNKSLIDGWGPHFARTPKNQTLVDELELERGPQA